MKKILCLLFVFPFTVSAATIGDHVDYSGYVKTDVWIETKPDSSHQYLSSLKNTFDIALEYKFSDSWAFFVHPRYFYDAAYDIRNNPAYDRNQHYLGHSQRMEWLRDCYFDYTSDALDVRIGKQQVVWGQMDIPILDKVMPWDLTNWFIPDLADMRIPLWMVKAEYSPKLNSTLQFLVIPDFEASRVAPPGASFSFAAYNDFYNLQQSLPLFLYPSGPMSVFLRSIDVDSKTPARRFENSTFGVRWRSMVGDLEYTFNWLYGFTTSAYLYNTGSTSTTVFPNVFIDAFRTRRHKRMQMTGFSLAKTFVDPGPLEGITVKGEFSFVHDEPTYYGTPESREVTLASDKYNWGVALEKNIITNWLVSFQFLQFIVDQQERPDPATGVPYNALDTATYAVIDQVENSYVLKVMTDFMHERLKPEITIVYSDDNQGRITPKVFFELRDNILLQLGYVHFFGRPDSSNGQFKDNDQVMLGVKYTF